MSEIGEGTLVRIPCRIQQGAFPGEYLVTFQADEKEISGFVRREFIQKINDTEGLIEGKVILKDSGHVTLQIQGLSFFTGASGKTSVSSSWADNHLAAAS